MISLPVIAEPESRGKNLAPCEAHKHLIAAAETRGWNAAIEMAAATIEIGQRQPASDIRTLRRPEA